MPEIRINPYLTPPLSTDQTAAARTKTSTAVSGESFGDILKRQISDATAAQDGIKFSKHAMQRLESRNISLNESDVARLNSAVDKASQKGVNDSLILMDNMAFIVSIPGKTVVTAMPVDEARENVFTHIDGAVMI